MIPTPSLPAREPAVTIGVLTTAVTALLALLVAFGIDLSQGQQVAILGVIAGVGPLVVAFVTRGRVAPASTVVAQQVNGAVIAGPASVLANGAPVEVWPVGTPSVTPEPNTELTPPVPPVTPPTP